MVRVVVLVDSSTSCSKNKNTGSGSAWEMVYYDDADDGNFKLARAAANRRIER